MNIAARLDEAMHEAKIPSQAALSRLSGVPQPTINRILKGKGKHGPETGTIAALAAACGVTFTWLHEGKAPRYRSAADTREGERAQTQAHPAQQEGPAEKAPRFLRHWLSDDEAEHLAEYRSTTEAGRKLIRIATKRMKRDDIDHAMDKS